MPNIITPQNNEAHTSKRKNGHVEIEAHNFHKITPKNETYITLEKSNTQKLKYTHQRNQTNKNKSSQLVDIERSNTQKLEHTHQGHIDRNKSSQFMHIEKLDKQKLEFTIYTHTKIAHQKITNT